jgi:Flp pilus assembly protein TadG
MVTGIVVRLARPRQRGAAAVEFALVLPLLMLLVMGTIDWGYYFFIDQVVTNAAREGARAGAVAAASPASNPAQVARDTAQAYLTGAGLRGAGTVNGAPDNVGGGSVVRVTIAYPVGSVTGFLGSQGLNLVPAFASTVAVMRLEAPVPP